MQNTNSTTSPTTQNETNNKIKYLCSLQVDLEEKIRDMGLMGGDLKERSLRRQQNGRPLVSEGDVFYITHQIKMIAERHFEILFGRKWLDQPKEIKDQIASGATEKLIQEIINSPDPATAFELSQVLPATILQFEFEKVLPNFQL